MVNSFTSYYQKLFTRLQMITLYIGVGSGERFWYLHRSDWQEYVVDQVFI